MSALLFPDRWDCVASCTQVQAYGGHMNTKKTNDADALGWAPVEACTLPTAERPLRLAEFDDLFAASLRSIEHIDPTRARLLLNGDNVVADRTQRLADAERSCCSFFTFGVSTPEPGLVAFDIEVQPTYAEVLGGLVARADAALGTAS